MTYSYFLLCALVSYSVGMINPAFIIAKLRGFDIRTRGSENASGSNAVITMGKGIGAFCIFFDIFKSFAVCKLAISFMPKNPLFYIDAAIFVTLGHIFPVFMRFHGGKGFACLGGFVLAFSPKVFFIMLLGAVAVFAITRYLFMATIYAALVYPVVYIVMTHNYWGALLFIVSAIMIIKHIPNMKRVKNGTELRINFLWNRNKEFDRVKENGAEE